MNFGLLEYGATTGSVFAVSSGRAGSSWSRASATTSTAEMTAESLSLNGIVKYSATTAATAVAKFGVGEARPLVVAKYSAATGRKLTGKDAEYAGILRGTETDEGKGRR